MAITHVALSFIAPLSLPNPLQKGLFFLTSAVLVHFFFFSREQCDGKRCNRDWGRRWGRWEVELKGVMDERERWEETRRPSGVASSSSSNFRDMEYCSIIDATRKHWKSLSLLSKPVSVLIYRWLVFVPSFHSRLWAELVNIFLNSALMLVSSPKSPLTHRILSRWRENERNAFLFFLPLVDNIYILNKDGKILWCQAAESAKNGY